jgi:hypothetical protein
VAEVGAGRRKTPRHATVCTPPGLQTVDHRDCAESSAVSMGGCIASALTGESAVEVVRSWGLLVQEQE